MREISSINKLYKKYGTNIMILYIRISIYTSPLYIMKSNTAYIMRLLLIIYGTYKPDLFFVTIHLEKKKEGFCFFN